MEHGSSSQKKLSGIAKNQFNCKLIGDTMKTRYGTAYFRTKQDVFNYYFDGEQKLKEGAAIVGKPPLKEGDKLYIDKDGRYIVETNS
jgi:hypothetical protein